MGVADKYCGTKQIKPREFNFDTYAIKGIDIQIGLSNEAQWLLSVFEYTNEGHVTVMSYINNIYPECHQDLYKPIADIFSCATPAINGALS